MQIISNTTNSECVANSSVLLEASSLIHSQSHISAVSLPLFIALFALRNFFATLKIVCHYSKYICQTWGRVFFFVCLFFAPLSLSFVFFFFLISFLFFFKKNIFPDIDSSTSCVFLSVCLLPKHTIILASCRFYTVYVSFVKFFFCSLLIFIHLIHFIANMHESTALHSVVFNVA